MLNIKEKTTYSILNTPSQAAVSGHASFESDRLHLLSTFLSNTVAERCAYRHYWS